MDKERDDKAKLASQLEAVLLTMNEQKQQIAALDAELTKRTQMVEQRSSQAESEYDKISVVMAQQQNAVQRLEEKLKGTEAIIATLQSSQSTSGKGSGALETEGQHHPARSVPPPPPPPEASSSIHGHDSLLSPLLKTIWRQFDGLSESQGGRGGTSASVVGGGGSSSHNSVARWEARLANEKVKMEAAKVALKEERRATARRHAKLEQRRNEWKERVRRVRADDTRGKQILKVHFVFFYEDF